MKFLNFKKIIFIGLIIIIPLIFINIQRQTVNEIRLFQKSSSLIQSIQSVYFNYTHSIAKTVSHFTLLLRIKKNNAFLKHENSKLKINLMKMKELQLENDRLRNMLNFQQQTAFNLLPARIIAIDPFPEYHTATINRGNEDGIKKNMIALIESGVIGYVLNTKKNTSQILFLSDPNAVLPVTIQRSRVHGLIEGENKFFKLNYIQYEDDIQEGDIVVTSSIVRDFPPGLPVGTVVKIEKNDYDLKTEIEVRPLAHFLKIKELFIVLYQSHD